MSGRAVDAQLNGNVLIGHRAIGKGHPVFIIAEIGVNHNGDLRIARKLIDAAASSGADCVKFQTFRTGEFLADRSLVYEYKAGGRSVRENMFDMFRRLELPLGWHKPLFDHCRRKKIVPLTSVADRQSADAVRRIGVPALKLSSEDLINLPLIEYAAGTGLPLILSTGMADEEEIDDALAILRARRCRDAIFLHCVSVYPAPEEEVNLLRMKTLAARTRAIVGYSDHAPGITAALGAVALGAKVIEKHFTLDRNMRGPDHFLSSDPAEFAMLVRQIRALEKMMGSPALRPSATEVKMRRMFRRSIVAGKNLKKGHILTMSDMCLKRPGTGLRPRDLAMLTGKRLLKDVKADRQITLRMVR
ncbi:MAG: N-acetylneuraminate synthase family protein [Candidatus Omnitrophica bacterium]|nr:N-acetylneuraminate synthase family protein [Candidatus Omnitrophota bacterium]